MTREILPWRRRRETMKPARMDESANPFLALHREMDRLFDDFFGGLGSGLAWPGTSALRSSTDAWAVNVDLSENDREVRIVADVPGMEEKDIELELDDNLLTIKGEKRTERDEEQEDYHLMERTVGTFHRAIPLPSGLMEAEAKAHFKNGVLTITIPKSPDAKRQRKQIAITSE